MQARQPRSVEGLPIVAQLQLSLLLIAAAIHISQAAAAPPRVDVQLARVNHNGAKKNGRTEKVSRIFQEMRAAEKGVVGRQIFGEGAFASLEEREASLRCALKRGGADSIVIGFEKPEQIDETLKQMQGLMKT